MDSVAPTQRSLIMARVKSSGNKSTEVAMIAVFRAFRILGWRRNYPLIGKPDFSFPKQRLVVFVDGCFWHGCLKHCRIPVTNRKYWEHKIARNLKHDKVINRELRQRGWDVIRIWEHNLCGGAVLVRKLKKIKEIVVG